MGDKNKRRIDHAALFHVVAEHWKPLLQNEKFRKEMLRGSIGMIVFIAFAIFALSLNSTGKTLQKFMDEIEPPPEAVLMRASGMRIGLNYFYKFPGMSDEEVRLYYKKILTEKNGNLKEKRTMDI